MCYLYPEHEKIKTLSNLLKATRSKWQSWNINRQIYDSRVFTPNSNLYPILIAHMPLVSEFAYYKTQINKYNIIENVV